MLNLATQRNSLARSTKSTQSHKKCAPTACKCRVSGSLSLPSRGSFHLSLTVLCAIGHQVVFSLGGWSPLLPARFLVSCGTLVPALVSILRLRAFYPLWRSFPALFCSYLRDKRWPTTPRSKLLGLGSFPFARRYLGNRCFFLFLPVLRCFSSRSAPRITMYSSYGDCALPQPGFPIQISTDQSLLAAPRGFSQLATSFFGAWCHWHPPCALVRLIT